jgi:ribosomal protein S18 acetylase RimI-like enzyme
MPKPDQLDIHISAASPADCRSVAQVHVASWQAAYMEILDPAFLAAMSVDRREASWQQALLAGKSGLLVGRVGSSVVGFSSFGASRDTDAPKDRGELWALYVHPDAWSTGAGRQLWQETQRRLLAQGYSSVSLWVLERNERAISFYSAAGFAVEPGSAKNIQVGGREVCEVRMVHPELPPAG